jgi:two-component sensor histidine kinase
MANELPRPVEASSTLAVIEASFAPLLFLDGDLRVIAASASFCEAFGIDSSTVTDRPLATLGAGEWNVRQLTSLLKATASGAADIKAYEIDLIRNGQEPRRLVLNAHRLNSDDEGHIRLLLAVVDVTDARADEKLKDDLLREKAILLQEVQHRVANSLQIIASVLMQSARNIQSEEARGQLRDAHHRVLSIASVQKQLAASTLGKVELRPYLTQLCESLGASMIQDHDQLSIEVIADDSDSGANASVSIGLIVTELVINALKHAFPGRRHGHITVSYLTHGPRWTLSVSDDGVGMPTSPAAKAGLGTGIVEALVRQLRAQMRIADTAPGTKISISNLPELAVVPSEEGRSTGSADDRGDKAF